MASTWKIGLSKGGAAAAQTTAALNASGLKITLRNHADDVATWTCEGDGLASAARFGYGDDISIWKIVPGKAAKRVFRGAVTSIPREGTGEAERVRYEARGGWYWLSKCYYTQDWAVGAGGWGVITVRPGSTHSWGVPSIFQDHGKLVGRTQSKTRVVLGGGNPSNQIRDILSRAIAAGAPIAIGSVAVASASPPADEQVDLTCAAAIDRLLAWFPDTSVCFDYAGTGNPKIHLRRRAALPAATLPVANAAESVSATPRHDLVVPGVEIVYETTSTKDDKTWRDVAIDSAGTPSALGAARFTIALDGSHETSVRQRIVSQRIFKSSLSDPDWWAKRLPELKGWTGADGTGKPLIRKPTDFPKAGGATLDKELLSGTIQPWMPHVSSSATIECTASYALGGEVVQDRRLRLSLTLTNASSGLYSSTQSRQEGETVPRGLAAQVFAAVKHLYYQGQIKFAGEDPPHVVSPGHRLNLDGGLPAWKKMDSSIQTVELAADTGSTTISFGPPEHLGPQDLVQLAQANRRRRETHAQTTYAKPEISASSSTLGGLSPDTSSGHAGGTIAKQTFQLPDNSRSVSIDARDTAVIKLDGGSSREIKLDAVANRAKITIKDTSPASQLAITADGIVLTKGSESTSWPSQNAASGRINVPAFFVEDGGQVFGMYSQSSGTATVKVNMKTFHVEHGLIVGITNAPDQEITVPCYVQSGGGTDDVGGD